MISHSERRHTLLPLLLLWFELSGLAADTFRVATYNVEGYLTEATETRHVKAPEARAAVWTNILLLHPEVLALQEIGTTNALFDLQDGLRRGGLDLPFWMHISAEDTNIHLAVLSKFPLRNQRAHTRDAFVLSGRRHRVSRGFAEAEVAVNADYSFTLLAAHFKSKRPVPAADETEMRVAEARLLREKIDDRLKEEPNVNLVVLGDFNDTPDTASTKAVVGRYSAKLIDTRPAERQNLDEPGDVAPQSERTVTWTHHYAPADDYRRIDYILLSRGMAREWVTNQTGVLARPDWGRASDHRPVAVTFEARDR